MSVYSIFAIALFASTCEALAPDFPRATPIQGPLYNGIGFSPKPTAAPRVPRDLLYRRDFLSNSASYVLIAPDQTCGYVSGLPGADFQCDDSTSCVFFPATGSSNYGAVGCCTDLLSCGFRTACVDSKAFHGSGCNGGCQLDVYTMKCTKTDSPYCGSIRYAVPGATIEQYFCNSEETSSWQTAYTTFNGESTSRAFKSVARAVLLSSAASSSSTSSSSKSKSSSLSSSSTSSAISSTPTNSATGVPTGPSSDKSGPTKEKSSNTGAIVGGLIGSAAVLGLIGAAAFLIYKRKYSSHARLSNLDPNQITPTPNLSSFQAQPQYHPVPVEMDTDFVQRPHPPRENVYEKSASTPMVATMSPPMNLQYKTPALYDRPISEIDSNLANNQ